MPRRSIGSMVGALVLAAGAAASAQPVYTGLPAPLQRVAFEQRLGESVDLSLPFVDERGQSVELGELVVEKPVVLALVYYDCPMLCSMTLNGLVSSLKALELSVGREFDVLAVSFDPRETPALAAAVEARAVESYHREGSEPGWHFLTGSQESIDALTDAVGFEYTWDDEREEFAHAA
ncbi:MAG: SCO family protein, partial [Thermoanaerobaculia bacterium]|nr:SCO family protein [Thermoanaerobaculia bacterium]